MLIVVAIALEQVQNRNCLLNQFRIRRQTPGNCLDDGDVMVLLTAGGANRDNVIIPLNRNCGAVVPPSELESAPVA